MRTYVSPVPPHLLSSAIFAVYYYYCAFNFCGIHTMYRLKLVCDSILCVDVYVSFSSLQFLGSRFHSVHSLSCCYHWDKEIHLWLCLTRDSGVSIFSLIPVLSHNSHILILQFSSPSSHDSSSSLSLSLSHTYTHIIHTHATGCHIFSTSFFHCGSYGVEGIEDR